MMSAKRKPKRGFTLIEVLFVVVLLSILAVIVLAKYKDYQRDAKAAAAATIQRTVQLQVDAYFGRHGEYPDTIDPSWFGRVQLPPNPFHPDASGVVDINPEQNKFHPINKASYTAGNYWYNPITGRFRVRVEQCDTDEETLELYNTVNHAHVEGFRDTR